MYSFFQQSKQSMSKYKSSQIHNLPKKKEKDFTSPVEPTAQRKEETVFGNYELNLKLTIQENHP